MNNTIKKEVYLIIAFNETAWYGKDDVKERLAKLPLTYQYAIRKNMKPLNKMIDEFNTFKGEKEQALRDFWFDDEHATDTTTKDESGNEVPAKKIKDEYREKYEEAVKELNSQLEKLLSETDEVVFNSIDLDSLVESAPDNSITIDDVDMISLFSQEDSGDE